MFHVYMYICKYVYIYTYVGSHQTSPQVNQQNPRLAAAEQRSLTLLGDWRMSLITKREPRCSRWKVTEGGTFGLLLWE